MQIIRGILVVVVAIVLYVLIWPAFGFGDSDFNGQKGGRAVIIVSGMVLVLVVLGIREAIGGKRK